jgi:hypothetical protein
MLWNHTSVSSNSDVPTTPTLPTGKSLILLEPECSHLLQGGYAGTVGDVIQKAFNSVPETQQTL